MTNLYAVLGLKKPATPAQIKSAYRRKAKTTHPDVEGGSTKTFAKLSEAYRVLSDPAARALYDETGIINRQCDNYRAGLLSIINGVLSDLLMHDEDFLDVDLVGVISSTIAAQISGHETTLRKLTAAKERAMRMQGRFTADGETDNLFDRMIEGHTAEYAKSIQLVREQIGRRKAAIAELKHYRFAPELSDIQKVFATMGTFQWTAGST